jgi:hypothetical protein
MLRSILAVLAGFLTPAILVSITDLLMASIAPGLFPTPAPGQPYQVTPLGAVINLSYGTAFAVLGADLMAAIAQRNLRQHMYWLIGLLVLFGLASAAMYAGLLPLWYSLAVVALGIVGIVLGVRLYASRHAAEPEALAEAPPSEPV